MVRAQKRLDKPGETGDLGRVGDETRKLSFSDRQELIFDKGQSVFEATLLPEVNIADLDTTAVERYAHAVAAPNATRLLKARGLVRGGRSTIAACLLFSRLPEALFPTAHIRVLRWLGSEPGTGRRQTLSEDIRN